MIHCTNNLRDSVVTTDVREEREATSNFEKIFK